MQGQHPGSSDTSRDSARSAARAGVLGAALTALALLAALPPPAPPTLRLVPGSGDRLAEVRFEVVGLDRATLDGLQHLDWTPERWARLMAVGRLDDGAPTLEDTVARPLAGTYEVVKDVLRFTPRAPIDRGPRYRAVFDPKGLPEGVGRSGGRVSALFSLPAVPRAAAARR